MAVDKDLFLHDLAIVAIMKNEGHYIKEWLDYHLLAGVDHFYIYDNDSPDNQAEVAKPYVAAGLVDYIPAPGKLMHYVVCNDAVNRFKFQCRYMTLIDGDEFIYPKVEWGGGYCRNCRRNFFRRAQRGGIEYQLAMFRLQRAGKSRLLSRRA